MRAKSESVRARFSLYCNEISTTNTVIRDPVLEPVIVRLDGL